MKALLIAGLLASPLCAGAAFAQATEPPMEQAPSAGKAAPKSAQKGASKSRQAASLDCSRQADAR
jgi:hypothetical protein